MRAIWLGVVVGLSRFLHAPPPSRASLTNSLHCFFPARGGLDHRACSGACVTMHRTGGSRCVVLETQLTVLFESMCFHVRLAHKESVRQERKSLSSRDERPLKGHTSGYLQVSNQISSRCAIGLSHQPISRTLSGGSSRHTPQSIHLPGGNERALRDV